MLYYILTSFLVLFQIAIRLDIYSQFFGVLYVFLLPSVEMFLLIRETVSPVMRSAVPLCSIVAQVHFSASFWPISKRSVCGVCDMCPGV